MTRVTKCAKNHQLAMQTLHASIITVSKTTGRLVTETQQERGEKILGSPLSDNAEKAILNLQDAYRQVAELFDRM